MLNVRYRMSDVQYRIRYLQKLRYRRFLVQVLAIFVYDVVYDIVRNIAVLQKSYTICKFYVGIIRYRTSISYAMSVLYDIARLYLQKRTPTPYDVVRNIVTYDVTYDIACLGLRLRRACPWSAHRPCPMILGPARWSVLHRDSPDALSLSLACATAANVSGDSLLRAKIGISS